MAEPSSTVSRRQLFAAAISAASAAGLARPAEAAEGRDDSLSIAPDGQYERVALAKPVIRMSVIQSRVRQVDLSNLRASRRANLDHMLSLIDAANNFGGPKDLLFFHEFPITGYSNRWDRRDALRAAIRVPGPETEAIGRKAREYGCYIVFGSYAKDEDWPDHLLSLTTIIGPDGDVIETHWKARNIKAVFGPGFELFTTTIYDVLEEYLERYGVDAIAPVTRTPIGNIITSSIQREPELFRVFAMKGAEIMLRTATGGFSPVDIQATSLYNRCYTAIANNALSPNNPGFFPDNGNAGGSAIYGPDGELINAANSVHETPVTATIPIAQFRARHRPPQVHMDLYRSAFEAYQPAFAPNLLSQYLPSDTSDAYEFFKDKNRWSRG